MIDIDFEEVPHPDRLIYRDRMSGCMYEPAGVDEEGDLVWRRINPIILAPLPQIAAPAPVFQIPQYSESRARERSPQIPPESHEEVVNQGDIETVIIRRTRFSNPFKSLPIEFRIALIPM